MHNSFRPILLLLFFLAASACAMTPPPKPQVECIVGGCSAQLCTDAALGPMASTCEWRAEYGCYKAHSRCGQQADGQCGWDPTPALRQCLDNAHTAKPPGSL